MSEEKLEKLLKKVTQIQNIAATPQEKNGRKEYGSYQHFQSECMQKVDSSNPNSPSRVEVITNKYGAHSTERMAQCGALWKKYRGHPDPIKGLYKELRFAEKVERGEVDEP